MSASLEFMVASLHDELVRLRGTIEDMGHTDVAKLRVEIAGLEEERAQLIRDLNQEIARADKAEAKVAWWEEDKDEVKMVKTINAYRQALEEHAHECDDIQWCADAEDLLEENPFADEKS